MAIDRRSLMGIGAAVALSAVTTACRSPAGDGARAPAADPASRTPVPPPSTSPSARPKRAFAGQPPPGHLYYGASLPPHRSLPAWEAQLGTTLALNRSYFTPERNEAAHLVHQCRADLRRRRLPHVSTKVPGSWRDVADGRYDGWLAEMLTGLAREQAPVFFTLHHEPENDAGAPGWTSSDFVAMQRRAIRLARGLAPEVTVVPVLQRWTFEPLNSHGDPAAWLVPEAAVMGVDIYNAWSPTNGKAWRSFGSCVDDVLGWVGDQPVAIGEYGCREDPLNPGLAADWLRDAADYARDHHLVSLSYFNSAAHSPDGSLELSADMERTFARLLGSEWVARPV